MKATSTSDTRAMVRIHARHNKRTRRNKTRRIQANGEQTARPESEEIFECLLLTNSE